MANHPVSGKIWCPVILCAFNVSPDSQPQRRFDFSIINQLDEFQQPSIPYFTKTVDYDNVLNMLAKLDCEIDSTDLDKLRRFGRFIWNQVVPRRVGEYLRELNEEYAVQVLLITNDNSIPWEITHDDEAFWSLRYSMGRIVGMAHDSNIRPTRSRSLQNTEKPRILIIYDPEGNLPYAKDEGEELCLRLKDRFEIKSLTGQVDACDFAMEIGSDEYDIIHFAGHAEVDAKHGLRGYESILESRDIADYSLPRKPVVFANACATVQNNYYGANSKNIAEAFIEAGASAFIGTLWKTSDRLSADFAAEFYDHLLSSRSIGDALRLAKQKFFSSTKADEVDWASFTLFGDPANRLFSLNEKGNVNIRRVQIRMSNKAGTLGRVLVQLCELGVNIIAGRSITLESEIEAGYVAELEIPSSYDEDAFVSELEGAIGKDLLLGIRIY